MQENLNATYTISSSDPEEEKSNQSLIEETQKVAEETCTTCESLKKQKESDTRKIKELSRKLKEADSNKHALENKLSNAMTEINNLRRSYARLEESLKISGKSRTREEIPFSSKGGASLILSYESKINSLEQDLREKNRILEHTKKVLEDASTRENKLIKNRDSLLGKIAILESVKGETEEAKLVSELQKAKITINRLQREINSLKATD